MHTSPLQPTLPMPSRNGARAVGLHAAALAALMAVGMLADARPVAAQQGFGNFFTYQQPRKKRPAARKRAPAPEAEAKTNDAAPQKTAEKSGPQQPVYVVVSLADQHASIYDANGFVTRTRVSTGMAGHRTPTGVFSIIGKSRWHRSNIYSGAPMPFMQRITWSGVAMHAGVVPGYPASHGCIRLPAGFAPQLFGMTRMGARVVVSPRDVQPVDFSHALLPLPKMYPSPAVVAKQASTDGSVELASVETSDAVAAAGTAEPAAPPAPRPLDPIAYASVLKERAVAERALADKNEQLALEAAQAAGSEARQAVADVQKAEIDLAAAERTANAPSDPGTTGATGTAVEGPAATLETARAALDEARQREAAKTPAAFAAVQAWKQAAAAAEDAKNLVEEADRRREQVSVLISRKEGRIFIRQNWKDVWEAPVTFRDGERPLGTHVYTLVDVASDGSSPRWTALSMPPESQAAPARGRGKEAETEPAPTPETAAAALDRVELPDGARERIAELLWKGGSLIVTDQPRSYEMGEYTDFIVLTR